MRSRELALSKECLPAFSFSSPRLVGRHRSQRTAKVNVDGRECSFGNWNLHRARLCTLAEWLN